MEVGIFGISKRKYNNKYACHKFNEKLDFKPYLPG